VVNGFRDRPAGTLRLNVPVSAARLVLPAIVPPFLAAYPDIRLEVIAEESFVDVLAAGCDAGIRYDERLEQDMIAVPIGPRTAALRRRRVAGLSRSPRPAEHPRDLLAMPACAAAFQRRDAALGVRARRRGGAGRRDRAAAGAARRGDRSAVDAAIAGHRHHHLFEDWLRPHLDSGALEPVLEPWWQRFSGPFLYYPGRRLVPAPLRAFVDFIKTRRMCKCC
jgi:DNA-binding transcriptional LysR family regulator